MSVQRDKDIDCVLSLPTEYDVESMLQWQPETQSTAPAEVCGCTWTQQQSLGTHEQSRHLGRAIVWCMYQDGLREAATAMQVGTWKI